MKRIKDFGEYKLQLERIVYPGEISKIKKEITDYLEKQKRKIGKVFGPKNEEEAKQRTYDKFSKYGFAKEFIWPGSVEKVEPGWGDTDGTRHDNEPGLPWDDYNSPYEIVK